MSYRGLHFDSGTKAKLKLLYPDFAVRIIRVYVDMWEKFSIQMRLDEGIRTFQRQRELFAQGRDGKPGAVVTHAPPGFSLHHYGVACDSCRKGKEPYNVPWEEFAQLSIAHGLRPGYYWPGKKQDKPHLELAYGGMGVEQMANLYQNGGLTSVWAEFDKVRGVQAGSEWYGPQKAVRILNLGDLS